MMSSSMYARNNKARHSSKLVGIVINPGQRRTEAMVTIELVRLAAIGMLC